MAHFLLTILSTFQQKYEIFMIFPFCSLVRFSA
jgi:hypothetical protein